MSSGRALEEIRRDLARSIGDAARETLGAAAERIAVERPPNVALGDLASPVAFDLAKSLRRSPRSIAEEIARTIALPVGVASVRVEGSGYVNFFLDRADFAARLLEAPSAPAPREGKVIVEHTNINPNKAAHIGHMRNAVLGDVLVRALRFLGHEVEVQNYLDDTGVQVADVVAGLLHLAGVRTIGQARRVIETAALPGGERNPKGFAYLCWDLYAEVGRTFQARPETRTWRTEALHAIEAGGNETAAIANRAAIVMSVRSMRVLLASVAWSSPPRERSEDDAEPRNALAVPSTLTGGRAPE